MDRTEQAGIGIAVAGHALLFAALAFSIASPKVLPKLESTPVEVSLIEETAKDSASPDLRPAPAPAPAPAEAEAETPPEPTPVTAPAPPEPKPVTIPAPKPTPAPKPVPLPKPTPPKPAPAKPLPAKPVPAKPAPAKTKPTPAKPAPAKPSPAKPAPAKPSRPGLALDSSIVGNARNERGRAPATTPPAEGGMRAQKSAAQWEASFIQSVLRKIQPHWKAPTGPDAEQLKTNLMIRLNRDGSIAAVTVQGQTGVTDSNQNLKPIHAERAIKAVQRAGRFDGLPDELYDIWQTLGPITFDKKL